LDHTPSEQRVIETGTLYRDARFPGSSFVTSQEGNMDTTTLLIIVLLVLLLGGGWYGRGRWY
jgi:hypothetical protein